MQTGTLMDYLCPTIGEMTEVRVMDHLIIPTPKTLSSAKGVGESTAQTVPVTVTNAIADAVRHLGGEITEIPVTLSKLWEQMASAVRPFQEDNRSWGRMA